ncbi:MAG: 2-keto-4-pentenoate hydratase [Kiloniellaceae bacterium]
MSPEDRQRAGALLLAARRNRSPILDLPDGCRPRDLAEAYGIQNAFVDAMGGDLAGFKIGATSRRAQDFLAVERPFFGCMSRAGVHASPATLSAGRFIFRLIEPEFAVRLGADLPPRAARYGRDQVAAAVAGVHPGFEVVTSAFGEAWTEVGALALIADNGVHGAFVLGPGTDDWRALDLAAHGVTFRRNGREEGTGRGANALGHPLDALAWLAGQDVRGGRGLKAGDLVTTGVVTPFIYAEAGDDLVADFGALGEVRLDFTP